MAAAPAAREWVLPNGLRIVFQANEPTATVVMCAFVEITSLHEVRSGPGIRWLTNTMVGRADSCEDLVREAAVRVQTAVAADYVEVVVSAPAESVEQCAEVLRSALFAPKFDAQALENERAVVLRQFAARGEIATDYATDVAYGRLYPNGSSAAWGAGDPVAVSKLTLEQVRSFHAGHYLPNATVISVSGGVAAESTRELLTRVMGNLLPGGIPQAAPRPAQPGGEARVTIDWPGPSAALCVAAQAVDLQSPDYPAAATAMVLLASGSGSRLQQALRVDRALAYTIWGDITPSAIAPMLSVLVTCEQDQIAEVEAVVNYEMDRLASEAPDAGELLRAKRYLIGQHALRHQRNQDIAHYLGVFELLGGTPGYRLDTLLAGKFAGVGATEVQQVAAEMFGRRIAVVLRDEAPAP